MEAASYESLSVGLMFGINSALFLDPVKKYAEKQAREKVLRKFIDETDIPNPERTGVLRSKFHYPEWRTILKESFPKSRMALINKQVGANPTLTVGCTAMGRFL